MAEEIRQLKDEVARLKGNPAKPSLKPSTTIDIDKLERKKTSGGSKKKTSRRKRKKNLIIHNTENVELTVIPEGSVAICSESIKVQDILIRPNNTEYTRKVWKTPDGELIRAKWPEHIDGQFGFHLKSYIISLYFDSHITQPSILRHLIEVGIDISSGEIHNILVENKDIFHKEKEDILKVGLQISRSITTDDTGLRHRGANGYCTHIGNEFFAYFKSSNSKSRINFLEILRGNDTGYRISGYSVDYYKNQKLSENVLRILSASRGRAFKNKSEWENYPKVSTLIVHTAYANYLAHRLEYGHYTKYDEKIADSADRLLNLSMDFRNQFLKKLPRMLENDAFYKFFMTMF